MLTPIFEEASNKIKEEFPVSDNCFYPYSLLTFEPYSDPERVPYCSTYVCYFNLFADDNAQCMKMHFVY